MDVFLQIMQGPQTLLSSYNQIIKHNTNFICISVYVYIYIYVKKKESGTAAFAL